MIVDAKLSGLLFQGQYFFIFLLLISFSSPSDSETFIVWSTLPFVFLCVQLIGNNLRQAQSSNALMAFSSVCLSVHLSDPERNTSLFTNDQLLSLEPNFHNFLYQNFPRLQCKSKFFHRLRPFHSISA